MDGAKSRHHLYWPKRDYKTPLEKMFRSLPCNIRLLDEADHHRLHLCQKPPKKPSVEEMRNEIALHNRGQCDCKRKKSNLALLQGGNRGGAFN